jgi:hypothetical protein
VDYNGAPVPGGNISFHTEKGPAYTSSIGRDGTYEIVDLPAGLMVVSVETETANPNKKSIAYGGTKGSKMYAERMAAEGRGGAAKQPAEAYRKIPGKYANPKTSPLSVTLEAGRQVHNFVLAD